MQLLERNVTKMIKYKTSVSISQISIITQLLTTKIDLGRLGVHWRYFGFSRRKMPEKYCIKVRNMASFYLYQPLCQADIAQMSSDNTGTKGPSHWNR